MKKWFMVLCLSFVSALAFAQTDPHIGSSQKFSQKDQQDVLTNIADKVSNRNGLEDEFHKMEVALQRKVAQAETEAKDPAVQQQPQTYGPHEDGITDAVTAPSSNRPSYYAEEDAYKNCNGIEICRTWAAEQAQNNPHFQVLSANLSMPDYHNQRLEVTYVVDVTTEKKVFQEDFGRWQ